MICSLKEIGARPSDVYANTYEGWTRFIKKANEITKQAKDEGLDFSYHNHEFEFEKWNGVTAMDRLIDEVPQMLITLSSSPMIFSM